MSVEPPQYNGWIGKELVGLVGDLEKEINVLKAENRKLSDALATIQKLSEQAIEQNGGEYM